MTLTRRRMLRTAATTSLLGLAAGRALADTADLYAAAKREGSITYYASAIPTLTARLLQAFGRAYPGIAVTPMRLATGQMAQRYASEAQAGNVVADVIQLADPFLMADAQEKGWIAAIDDLPAYAAFPADFKRKHDVLIGIFPHTIVSNTSMLQASEYPKDWRALLDPKWKGQIILSDPRDNLEVVDWIYTMFDAYGADYLQRMRVQEPKWSASVVPGIQMMIAGEAAVLAPALHQATASFIARGAPVVDFVPALTSGHETYMAVSAAAPHPNGARLLANFLLTREGQEAYTKDLAASPLPNIPGAVVLGPDYKRSRLPEARAKRPELLALLGLR